MQPYLDSYKLAGIIGIIADKEGRVHYENLIGYADVEAKETDQRRQCFLGRLNVEDVRRSIHHDVGRRR